MIGVDDDRNSGEPGGEAPDESRFGRMGVDDMRTLPSQEPVKGDQRLCVSWLERRLGDDLRDDDRPDASLHGKVQQRPFPWIFDAGHQDGLEPRRIQAGGEIDYVDRRATDIEPGDHSNDFYLSRMSPYAEIKLWRSNRERTWS